MDVQMYEIVLMAHVDLCFFVCCCGVAGVGLFVVLPRMWLVSSIAQMSVMGVGNGR
ncbi:MAG: hypothetical protein Kow0080_15830 [Candidatus Promineifilaceae bacterium]